MADRIAAEIQEIHSLGVHVAATVGGGNIIRGISISAAGMDRVSGDYMGMLANSPPERGTPIFPRIRPRR